MYFIVYKTTNNVNGKIYIGKHICNDLNDGYIGSGKLLRRAIQKYGRDCFTREILFSLSTEAEMNDKEAELVTEDFCNREDTYNVCPGGNGGFGYINSNGLNSNRSRKPTPQQIQKMLETRKGKPRPPVSEETGRKISKAKMGHTVSDDTRRKMSQTRKKLYSGGMSDDIKKKISESLKNVERQTYVCPHCNKTGGAILKRWHFDNCKHK
jgi:hypothetical protein